VRDFVWGPAMLCPVCQFREGYKQKIQIDRPCVRCSYFGDWFGTPVFSWMPELTLRQEARIAAAQVAEAVICEQERPRQLPN
jgi:hypothetical protein